MFLKKALVKTVINQGESICELSTENEKLKDFKENVVRLIEEADRKQENYFITFEKIKELV